MGTYIGMRIFILSRLPELLDNLCQCHCPNCFDLFRKGDLIHKDRNSFIKFRKRILPKQVTFNNYLVASKTYIRIVTDNL